ncbi:unnamed protein product [Prorocentrum cordatum]|uniref:G domain-containing protein n=1 Tax=Prorocentrum cordatum TaxID=2364126 RepID=A0ABN9TZL0_9DINO|nr:unnamed protein product [Polarella glacialis]
MQVTEARARSSAEAERSRTLDSLRAAQQELQATQLELQATERNRAELAVLLEATIASSQAAHGGAAQLERSHWAAMRIQARWRMYRARLRQHGLWRGAHDPYDAIVCFDSLSSTIDADNLKISILKWAHSAFEIDKAQMEGIRIVAHMGLFDKGKTFLINQVYGKNLPSGKLHETSGLSIVYVPKLRFLVIDTKGLQAPVSYKKRGVRQLVDASQTEVFMFELVSRIAHYIVFVVNDFTWPEQRHVVQLHQKYVQSKRENQLIVLHNLRTTRSVREATELFYKQVASKYEGVDRGELGGLIFTVDESPRIHHIGLAEQGSPAGNRFNQKNKAHLLQLLDQLEGIGERSRSLASLLQEHFAQLLPEFIYLESSTGERQDGSGLVVRIQLEEASSAAGVGLSGRPEPDAERDPTLYRSVGMLTLQVPDDHVVHMKTEGVFSEFCELVAQDVTFKPPPPNFYEQRLKDKLVRVVEFEVPGVWRKNIKFRKGNRGYSVSMVRAKDESLGGFGVCSRFQAPRIPTGEFVFDLFFDDGIWDLDGGREAVTHENGMLRVRLKQDLQGEIFSLDDL